MEKMPFKEYFDNAGGISIQVQSYKNELLILNSDNNEVATLGIAKSARGIELSLDFAFEGKFNCW